MKKEAISKLAQDVGLVANINKDSLVRQRSGRSSFTAWRGRVGYHAYTTTVKKSLQVLLPEKVFVRRC